MPVLLTSSCGFSLCAASTATTNMRLRDAVVERGAKAKKESAKAPKDYPLSNENWSSCDESDEEDAGWAEVQATMGF